MKSQFKNFTYLTVSTLIMAAGIYFFKFTNNFTFGGITGLAVLVAKSGVISASDFSFVANMILLVIGFFVLGRNSPPRPLTAASFCLSPYRRWNESIL